MNYTKDDQINYLVKKVVTLRKKCKGNLFRELGYEGCGRFMFEALVDCPIPGTRRTLRRKDEFSENWKAAMCSVMLAVVLVAEEEIEPEEIKRSLIA